jgi:heme exporter protein D
MDLGPHAAFIVAAYAIVIVVVAALIGWVITDYRRQRTTLQELERSGLTRRSARQASAAS